MKTIREILNEVWSIFRMSGVADDLAIIEHLGALLVENIVLSNSDLSPRRVTLPNLSEQSLRPLLDEALLQVEAAELFDRHILFRLSSMQPGGRYPTPRHIVRFMQAVSMSDSAVSVADFACGSGGLLLRSEANPSHTVTGCDISSEWTRIAWINCALSKQSNANLRTGNAIRFALKGGWLSENSFERILMNPSFGEPMEPDLIDSYFGSVVVANRSEAALFRLALDKLSPGGRAVVLLPVGLLSGNTSSDRSARAAMTEFRSLAAVVALPRDSIQPYSPIQGHVVIVDNNIPPDDAIVWLLAADDDGYPAGRTKDYSRAPSPSDLDLIRKLLSRTSPTESDGVHAKATLWLVRLSTDNTVAGTALFCRSTQARITEIRFYPTTSASQTSSLLLVVEEQTSGVRECVEVTIASSEVKIVASVDEFEARRQKLEGRSKNNPIEVKLLYSDGPLLARAALISDDGRLLGIAVTQQELKGDQHDLRPESHLRFVEEPLIKTSPGALLVEIKANQQRVNRRLENLLGRIDQQPISSGRELSTLLDDPDAQTLSALGAFSSDQLLILTSVLAKRAEAFADGDRYWTPVPFTADEIRGGLVGENRLVDPTLQILCRLGIVIPVTIAMDGSPTYYLYRLATERDKWTEERLLLNGDQV